MVEGFILLTLEVTAKRHSFDHGYNCTKLSIKKPPQHHRGGQ